MARQQFKKLHIDNVKHVMAYRVVCEICGTSVDIGDARMNKITARAELIASGWQQGPGGGPACPTCVAIATAPVGAGSGVTTSAVEDGGDVTLSAEEAAASITPEAGELVDVLGKPEPETSEPETEADEAEAEVEVVGAGTGSTGRRSRRH